MIIRKTLSWLLFFYCKCIKKGISSTVLLLLHTIHHARMILWSQKHWRFFFFLMKTDEKHEWNEQFSLIIWVPFSSQAPTSHHASWTTFFQRIFSSMKTCLSVSLRDRVLMSLIRLLTWWETPAMNSELFLCLLSVRDFCYKIDLKWLFWSLHSHTHIHRMTSFSYNTSKCCARGGEFTYVIIRFTSIFPGCCDWQGNLDMSGFSSSFRVSVTWN